jgi:HSP20 family protein
MKDLDGLVDRVERSFDATFGGLAWSSMVGDASPPLNVDETEDSYVVKMELPSVKREEVRVDLVGKNLNITGEIKETERKGIFRRQTRRTGRFACRVIVPSRVDAKRTEAHLTGGLLTVPLPKTDKDQRRRIPVVP